jgi:hypothetical protein
MQVLPKPALLVSLGLTSRRANGWYSDQRMSTYYYDFVPMSMYRSSICQANLGCKVEDIVVGYPGAGYDADPSQEPMLTYAESHCD